MGNRISGSGEKAAKDMENHMNTMSHRMGSIFSSIGSAASNMGIPFASVFSKMGAQLSAVESRGQGVKLMLADVGKMTLTIGAAAAIAVGAEGLHMWDAYEKAIVSLKTVVTDTGTSWVEYQKPLAAVNAQMQHLGFNETDVAQMLGNLTMATGSATKGLNMAGLAANLAAYKNVSLAGAADALDSVLGGSTRTLLHWGININVASGRLHNLQTMQEALQKAQLNLVNTQEKINAGMLSGIAAYTATRSAQLAVRDATIQYREAQDATNKVLTVLSDRVAGAAANRMKTFAGQMMEARATVHNFGIDIGGVVSVGLQHLEVMLANVINFFAHFKAAAAALATVIVGPLVAAVGFYLVGAIDRLGTSLLSAGGRMDWFGLQARYQSQQSITLQGTLDRLNALLAVNAGATERAGVAAETAVAPTTALAGAEQRLTLAITEQQMQFAGMPAKLAAASAAQTGYTMTVDGTVVALNTEKVAAKGVFATLAAGIGTLTAVGVATYLVGNEFARMWKNAQDTNAMAPVRAGAVSNRANEAFEAAQKKGSLSGEQAALTTLKQNVRVETVMSGMGLGGSGMKADATQGKLLVASEQKVVDALKQQHQDTLRAEVRATYMTGGLAATEKQSAASQAYFKEYGVYPGTSGPAMPPAGATPNVLVRTGAGLLQTEQQQLQQGTMQSLRPELFGAGTIKMQQIVSQLIDNGQKKLGEQILATYKQELAYYGALEANQQKVALNADTTIATTQYTDQTAIITDMAAKVVQGITDSSTIAQARATNQADIITDQAQTTADILGERGLYGLNLVAQRMKVSLDEMTTRYTQQEDAQSTRIAVIAAHGDATVAAAKVKVDALQKSSDLTVGVQQKISDLMANAGTTLQQAVAATGLTGAQANQARALAIADRAQTTAQNASNLANANAQKQLVAIQNSAKVAEAKANALLSIEQARANTEFAGSGVHIEITGINPTDAQAVASAVSWHMRTKVAGPR
jgi:hypothetical protein